MAQPIFSIEDVMTGGGEHAGDLFFFSYISGYACSVCAPADYDKADIEQLVAQQAQARFGRWRVAHSLDYGGSSKSPSTCNHDQSRQHWFLISEPNANMSQRPTAPLGEGMGICPLCGIPVSIELATEIERDMETDSKTCAVCVRTFAEAKREEL